MINFEAIKGKNYKELARFLCFSGCCECAFNSECHGDHNCIEGYEAWLEQDVPEPLYNLKEREVKEELKVEIQCENGIVFGDIYTGTCFELDGECYIKIQDSYTNNNAVSLSSGNTCFITDYTKVKVLSNAKVVLEE